ncbi:ATP-dependent DNA helicase RecG [Patescibacteria group bacterium]|nr:ATP-dependent DNA helicase RecG [Patescibacteria group bacterium]
MFFLLTDSINKLPGIGPSVASKFQRLDIATMSDLIYYYPRRWDDLSTISPIATALSGHLDSPKKVTVKATIKSISHFRSPYKRMFITNALAEDPSGAMRIVWFNQPYLRTAIIAGDTYYLSGQIGSWQNHPALTNPSFERATDNPLHSGGLIPVYPETEGISSKMIRRATRNLLNTIRHLPESLPQDVSSTYQLIPLTEALVNIHFPTSLTQLQQAKYRLGFEELFYVQLGLAFAKANWGAMPGQPLTISPKLLIEFTQQLPFILTSSQLSTIKKIFHDLAKSTAMNRLLAGDVGSGKTVVATAAIFATIRSGYQAALMAPTEVLAVQHYYNLKPLLDKFNIRTTLITGSQKLSSLDEIAQGKYDLIVGTHALIQQRVNFKNLNLVIIDEQHRFGVNQRQKLKNKSGDTLPHYLSLSATPIPRTIFLSLFSDLDTSMLSTLPKGRLPIITRLATTNNLSKVTELIEHEIKSGHQIFVVAPLIELDKIARRSSIASELSSLKELFPLARIATLHGKMPAEDKLSIMENLQNGQVDILLATSVIEVGIDIPQATVVWIKNAERFGLAQLHQLRGRVGRSDLQSYCLVETPTDDPDTIERLKSFIKINDGNKLAQMDLAMRGPGAFFGDQQSGFLKLKIANLTDEKLIKITHQAAQDLIKKDPTLKHYPQLKSSLQIPTPMHAE